MLKSNDQRASSGFGRGITFVTRSSTENGWCALSQTGLRNASLRPSGFVITAPKIVAPASFSASHAWQADWRDVRAA